jgi:two-component system, LytTR family, sensor kinase
MKLAQVYKYFLANKNRELISLTEELEFITNYYFLLQIRYDNKMKLVTELNNANPDKINIPPCSLQLLLENAIKHNEFSDTNPLQVVVAVNEHYLKVSNNAKPRSAGLISTGIGLQNLRSRYRLLGKKDIVIERSSENFTVKLPLIN